MKFALANGITHSLVGEQKTIMIRSRKADIVRNPKKESGRQCVQRTADNRTTPCQSSILSTFATEKSGLPVSLTPKNNLNIFAFFQLYK